MQYKLITLSALAGLAAAYTQPDTKTWPDPGSDNPFGAPLGGFVQEGAPFTITWTPTNGTQVSLLLVKGPSTNVAYYSTIADTIDNSGSYVWTPDTSIPTTTDPNGYGIQLVVEGTGQYQYTPQFGIKAADGSATTSGTSSVTSFGSVETAAPSGTTQGTAECGALNECPQTTDSASASTSSTSSQAPVTTPAAPVITAPTGSGNASAPVVQPTGPVTVPSSLATVATAGSTGAGAANSASGAGASGSSAPRSTGVSTAGAAVQGAQLTGVVAAVAGLLSFLL